MERLDYHDAYICHLRLVESIYFQYNASLPNAEKLSGLAEYRERIRSQRPFDGDPIKLNKFNNLLESIKDLDKKIAALLIVDANS